MVEPEDLPISTHVHVLGADITVHQRANLEAVRYGSPSGGLHGIRIDAFGSRNYLNQRCRKYLAAWARRNLFEGQPTG